MQGHDCPECGRAIEDGGRLVCSQPCWALHLEKSPNLKSLDKNSLLLYATTGNYPVTAQSHGGNDGSRDVTEESTSVDAVVTKPSPWSHGYIVMCACGCGQTALIKKPTYHNSACKMRAFRARQNTLGSPPTEVTAPPS